MLSVKSTANLQLQRLDVPQWQAWQDILNSRHRLKYLAEMTFSTNQPGL